MAHRKFLADRLLEVHQSLVTVDRDIRKKRATLSVLEVFRCRKAAARLRILLSDLEIALKSLAIEREELTRHLIRPAQFLAETQARPQAERRITPIIPGVRPQREPQRQH